jgi:two-component system phosphate regulon sensor histidine kinase PhoR
MTRRLTAAYFAIIGAALLAGAIAFAILGNPAAAWVSGGALLAWALFGVLSYLSMDAALVSYLGEVSDNLSAIRRGDPLRPHKKLRRKKARAIQAEIVTSAEAVRRDLSNSKETSRHLRLVLDNVSDGIVAFSKSREITFLNKKAKDIFGYSDAKGADFTVLAMGDDDLKKSLEAAYRSPQETGFDWEISGRTYHAVSAKDDYGDTLLVLSDVTLERQNSAMRRGFFDSASHELKTPLTSIRGFSEMLALNNKDPKLTPYIKKIDEESKRMRSLIDDMLHLSKLESSGEQVKEECDLRKVAEEAIASLAPLAKKKGVSVSVVGEARMLIAHEDAYSIIKNLTENGISYNDPGGYVKVTLKDERGRHASITVEDNGIGIAPSDQAHVFERFYRVDKSRSRATGGTGLGLSIVKHITEVYNGKISLFSTLGEGTRITVSF